MLAMKSIDSDLRDQSEISNVFLIFLKGLWYYILLQCQENLAIDNTNGVFCQGKYQNLWKSQTNGKYLGLIQSSFDDEKQECQSNHIKKCWRSVSEELLDFEKDICCSYRNNLVWEIQQFMNDSRRLTKFIIKKV